MSSEVVPRDPTRAIDFIVSNAERHAQARADVIQIENFMKSKRALLMNGCDLKTISDRECYALAHPDYRQLIEGLREAVYTETLLKTQIKAAELRVELFRTIEASNRRMDRATQ